MNMIEPTAIDHAYAAGLFDGEGCVMIARARSGTAPRGSTTKRIYHRLDLSVGQVDRRPLLWLQTRYGGRIDPVPKKRGIGEQLCWQWRLGPRAAEMFLRQVLPYLIVKREQAEVALTFRATIATERGQHKTHGGRFVGFESSHPVTADIETRREELRQKLSSLKRQAS